MKGHVQFTVESDVEAAKIYQALVDLGLAPRRISDRDVEIGSSLWQTKRAAERYHLTAAEAVALQQIFAGADSVEQLAEQLDLDVAAARGRVARLLRKTGAQSIADLAELGSRDLG